MKILYGVQGTGNGHLSRTRALLPSLKQSGVEIDFVFSGRKREDFFDMEPFGDFRLFQGLTLFYGRGKLQFLKTVSQNKLWCFLRDVYSLDLSAYDLVISDFEPISAWSAKIRGVPCIALSHQSAFEYEVPKAKGYWASKLAMKLFSPSKTNIGFHYHHFNQPILPPLIGGTKKTPTDKNKIVVYMGFEELHEVIDFVSPFTDYEFQIFAKVDQPITRGHIRINPLSHSEFHKQLNRCTGVISNAGFELSSEALQLGKKLLVKPLMGQYEQICNVLALKQLGRAQSMESLDQNILEQWLQVPPQTPINYPQVASPLADWILDANRCDLQQLAKQVWGSENAPESQKSD